ncbi:MAG: NAD(P)-dependent alcohol dehydrogenase [Polyangiales bacterium]
MVTVATSESGDAPLRLVDVPARPLGPRDVRVKVRAIGVNPVDWKMRSGGPLRLAHRFVGPPGPLVIGVDFSGEVIEAGKEADLPVGTRVVGGTDFSRRQLGSYASEVVVRDDQCASLPEGVSFDEAACLPVPGATALQAFRVAKAGKGSNVLVLGASGGVGLVTLQLARAMGMKTVGVCSTRNVALVERLGAIAVDYTKGDAIEAARAHGPFDLVVHAVGTATYPLDACRSLLSAHGVVALVVVRPADYPSLIRPSVSSVLGRPTRANLEVLVRALANKEIEPLIEARIPLAEAEKAHQISRAGKVVGKLLLVP